MSLWQEFHNVTDTFDIIKLCLLPEFHNVTDTFDIIKLCLFQARVVAADLGFRPPLTIVGTQSRR